MLHGPLALDGKADVVIRFVVDELLEVVGFGKPFHNAFAVLKNATDKVICDAEIKNAVRPICKNINISAFAHGSFKQGVDGRDKPGHDVERLELTNWKTL